jgi:hypothetical protein
LFATTATATPFVDVKTTWSATTNFSGAVLPAGFVISCFGGAITSGQGCSDSLTLNTSVGVPEHLAASSLSGLTLTNTTDHSAAANANFFISFSAFNPGGPSVGIGIDDPASQAANFSSSISGPAASDNHTCSVGFGGQTGTVFSPRTCGVSSPDSSEDLLSIDLSSLAPGQGEQLAYAMNITADFRAIPEPSSLVVLMVGLGGFWFVARRRSSSTSV